MDKEDKMRKTITKVVLIICAVSVALGIALCASGVVMGADVEKHFAELELTSKQE